MASGGDDGVHIVDLEKLIRQEITNLPSMTNPCIYKIPQTLRDVNPKAYTPFRVAIGPYHANNEHLKSMEAHKLRYLLSLMSRSGGGLSSLGRYVKAIEDREIEARKCYSGIEELDSQNFTRMLLLDGAFIVEFLCNDSDRSSRDSSIHGNDKTVVEVRQDLLLLENQLPFFILEDLYHCTFENPDKTFPEIAYSALCSCTPFILSTEDRRLSGLHLKQRTTQGTVNHLLHLLRMCCLDVPTPSGPPHVQGENPSDTAQMPRPGRSNWFRNPASVSELNKAGVQFRAQRGRFMYTKFDEATGVLEMSRFLLTDYTEIFIRNVIAYEQYYLNVFDTTNYMYFMAGLIDTKKDVDILEESQVIHCLLESKEDAANIFNIVTKYAVIRTSLDHAKLCHKLKAYTMKPWNKWNAILRRSCVIS